MAKGLHGTIDGLTRQPPYREGTTAARGWGGTVGGYSGSVGMAEELADPW